MGRGGAHGTSAFLSRVRLGAAGRHPVLGLAITIFTVMMLVACGDDVDPEALTNGDRRLPVSGTSESDLIGAGDANGGKPKISAKELFTTSVHGELNGSCAACHTAGPAPVWISKDVEGYVTMTSTLLTKGPHGNGGGTLTNAQTSLLMRWIDLEMKERGDKAPPSILSKLGDCLDAAKFEAIGFKALKTVTRTAKNNPNAYTENANACTGCKPVECSACHSADPGSGFLMAVGNDILEADHTFRESKSTTPPYIQKYLGLDVNGTPIPSKAIKIKSESTIQAKPYTHPMYVLTPQMDAAIDAFVNDAIAKYNAGQCGK
jgi:hypothetical protein